MQEDTSTNKLPEPDYAALAISIKAWGEELGFQDVRIVDAHADMSMVETGLFKWLEQGYHGDMDYMAKHGTKRTRPAELEPGTQRVISVCMNYAPPSARNSWDVINAGDQAFISRYALGRDYHKVLRARLQKLADKITTEVGSFNYRVFSDSAPVMEVAWAQKAGLGWRGKHTLLLSRQAGSMFFLGEMYIDLPLPIDNETVNYCGSCSRCIDICPTQAIIAPYQLDARRCISYLTIELKGSIPKSLRSLIGNRIYGCDDCQLVCPWNKFAKITSENDFQVRNGLDNVSLIELFNWDQQTFETKLAGSAIRRIGHQQWLRNIAVGLGNAPYSVEIVKALQARLDDHSALVREHVQWALEQQNKKEQLLRNNIMNKRSVIGTPLSSSATKVMLLGSGELGKEVIIALQRLGVETIAVDRYVNAPGHQVAHRVHVINMADGQALCALIEQERPDIIVPEIEAIATEMLVEIEQMGMAKVIPTARAVRLTMNREGIRCLAAETLGLPTSPYAFANSLDELRTAIDGEIGYPCIVKPVMSSSGKGQSRIDHAGEVEVAWNYAASGSRVNQGRVIIEGVIHFDYEITQLTVRALDTKGDINTYFCEPIGHVQVHGDYVESWQPQAMSPVALERAREIAKKITDNLGGLGIFGVELFIKGDEVWFSEVSPRPHDTGMVTMCSQRLSEFDLHARAILGLPVDTSLQAPGASAVIYGQLEAQGIAFSGVVEALSIPQSDLRLFGKPESFTRRRMGVALANGADTEEARSRAKLAASCVKPIKP